MRALYFAWIRERIGLSEEDINPPDDIKTVDQLIDWLIAQKECYAVAFANRKLIRASIDKVHVHPQASIASAREIAFFPPMTGG